MEFCIDYESNAALWVHAHLDDPRARKIWDWVVARPAARWFGDWNKDVESDVRAYMGMADQGGRVPIITLYNMYNRDNGGESKGGAASPDAYRSWVESAARGIGEHPVVVVVEPDSLAQLDKLAPGQAQEERTALVAHAAATLGALPQAKVYLDGGNATWVDAAAMADRLLAAQVAQTSGFAVNVANFDATDICHTYAAEVVRHLSRREVSAGYVIDTSRNGNGALDENGSHVDYCNPPGRRIGDGSSVGTGGADYFLWVKNPGDSDGSCGTGEGIPAGTFSPELAERLVDGV